jgi:hypothetical protein
MMKLPSLELSENVLFVSRNKGNHSLWQKLLCQNFISNIWWPTKMPKMIEGKTAENGKYSITP